MQLALKFYYCLYLSKFKKAIYKGDPHAASSSTPNTSKVLISAGIEQAQLIQRDMSDQQRDRRYNPRLTTVDQGMFRNVKDFFIRKTFFLKSLLGLAFDLTGQ